MMKKNRGLFGVVLILLLLMLFAAIPAKNAEAASLKKPKFKLASYIDGEVVLSWKKVPGAKSYRVYRSAKKNGNYRLFAKTGHNSLRKAAKGYYYYRVRAVRGGKVSKMSAPVHIFSATARVVGYYTSYYRDFIKIRVTNKTKSNMYFRGLGWGYRDGHLFILNSSKSILWTTKAYVTNSSGSYYIAYAMVPPKSTRYVYIALDSMVPTYYQYNPFMTTLSFFPKKPGGNIHFAFGFNRKTSAVAGITR